MGKLTNEQLVKVLDNATHVANIAYAVDRFFKDGNIAYHAAMIEEHKAGENGVLPNEIKNIEKMDKGPKEYQWYEHNMGRWGENTGDESDRIYYQLDDELETKGKELLLPAQLLVKELGGGIENKLADEYARAMRLKGCAGESNYIRMLEGSTNYEPYTPFTHGIFAQQVKMLCLDTARKRGIKLEEIEALDLGEIIRENIAKRESKANPSVQQNCCCPID
jgi:hypothetical protein